MIDILGMLLPGGLTLLLLEQDLTWMRDLIKHLDTKADNLLIIMIFLCGSYGVGMLLHEMGSCVEKLMWECPFFSPSIWAAVKTGLADRYNKDGTLQDSVDETGSVRDRDKDEQEINPTPKNPNGKTEDYKKKAHAFTKCINVTPALLTGAVAFGILPLGVSFWSLRGYILIVGVWVLVSTWHHWDNAQMVIAAYRNDATRTRLEWIEYDRVKKGKIDALAYINEEHSRKRGLFNGYYSMARSLLMMMALLQCYACLQSNKESSFMVLVGKINDNPAYLFLWMTVAVLLMSRYWHFACTRFSYTYNGFIHNKDNPEKFEYEIVEKTKEIQLENGVEQKNIERIKWMKK